MVRFVEVQRDEEDGGESSSSSESEAEEEVEQQLESRAPSSDEDSADEQEEGLENRQAGARHDPTRSRGSQGAPPARIKISLSRAIWCHVSAFIRFQLKNYPVATKDLCEEHGSILRKHGFVMSWCV